MSAPGPGPRSGGHEAILKDSRKSSLTLRGAHANSHAGIGHEVYVVRGGVAVVVENGEPGEKLGAERVQRRLSSRKARRLDRREDQPKLVPVAQAEVTEFSTAQLDALLASIAAKNI